MKTPLGMNVLEAAKQRISFIFDEFKTIYTCFSGGKDSTVTLHLIIEECIKRDRKVNVLFIDLEAQYQATIKHIEKILSKYKKYCTIHWICTQLKLRNGVSCFEPNWVCWDKSKKDLWVREKPYKSDYPIMEFEEFSYYFGNDLKDGLTACIVAIRTDESYNRERSLFDNKDTYTGEKWTTKLSNNLYNCYPIYDWKVSDIWLYHYLNPDKEYNKIYELMTKAGVNLKDQRICHPYGDDQKKGLWLYHLLEPETWQKVVNRVAGANSYELKDTLNKPDVSWKEYAELLINSMPEITKKHYIDRVTKYCKSWERRGYQDGIPNMVPDNLESRKIAPSWKAVCKALIKNDYWFRSLDMTQPFSKTYGEYLTLRDAKCHSAKN